MDKKSEQTQVQEITSFNTSVPDLPSLIELDELMLDQVSGGFQVQLDDCNGFSCNGYCGTF
jgi:hypothetical protein